MNINLSNRLSSGVPLTVKASRNSLFEAGLLVVICGLFYWFVIIPKQASVAIKQSDLETVQAKERKIAGALKTLQEQEAKLNNSKQEVSYLDQSLPLEGKDLRTQLLIEKLAASVGVTVANVNVTSKASIVAGNKTLLANPFDTPRILQTMTGSVYVVGTFNQLLSLIVKLENSGRVFDINSMALNGAPDGKLNMQITLNTYYFAP